MESVLGRYRNLIILVGVLFLQVLGLATQVKRTGTDEEHTRLIRIWVVGAITPFERGLIWIENGTGNLWHNYFYLRGVRAENRQLKDQIEQMRLEQVRLSEDAAQAHRLQALLSFKEQFISKTVAAQVIGSSGSDLSRIVYIDKGENAGIKKDMAVITADGIVGKVLLVYPSVAQVLVINDQTSGVGAILEKSRLQGYLKGKANGQIGLVGVMSDEQVAPGERVLTSGGDQIFPKGLPAGTVTKVANGKDLFLNISVKPAADLNKLEEVLVLVEKQERQTSAEDTTHVRAADILAQRLPSVPDKPAADPKAVGIAAAGAAKPAGANAGTKPAATAAPPAVKKSASVPGTELAEPKVVAQPKPDAAKPAPATTTPKLTKPASSVPQTAPQSGPQTAPQSGPQTAPPSVPPPVSPPPNDQTDPH